MKMAKTYNVIFEWDNEVHREDFPDLYVTYYDGNYLESRTYDHFKKTGESPKGLTLQQAIEVMEAQNSGKFFDLFGYRAVICNAIKKTETGFEYVI